MVKYALLLLLAIAAIAIGISLVLQKGQSILGIFFIIGAALVGAAAVISGINDAYDLLEKIIRTIKRRSLDLSPKIAKDVLLQLNDFGDDGIECDLFLFYLARAFHDKQQEERTKIYEGLKAKGYINLESGFIKITKVGKKFIHKA